MVEVGCPLAKILKIHVMGMGWRCDVLYQSATSRHALVCVTCYLIWSRNGTSPSSPTSRTSWLSRAEQFSSSSLRFHSGSSWPAFVRLALATVFTRSPALGTIGGGETWD